MPLVRVRARPRQGFDGFRRCGLFWPSEKSTEASVTDEQLAALKATPLLVVEVIEKRTGAPDVAEVQPMPPAPPQPAPETTVIARADQNTGASVVIRRDLPSTLDPEREVVDPNDDDAPRTPIEETAPPQPAPETKADEETERAGTDLSSSKSRKRR
jgi:hypothetical protein